MGGTLGYLDVCTPYQDTACNPSNYIPKLTTIAILDISLNACNRPLPMGVGKGQSQLVGEVGV